MSPTILITGGAGYLGSQLIRDLAVDEQYRGATLRIYDSLAHRRFDGLMDLPKGPTYEFVEGDILDRLNLERAMTSVDTVIHLAALVSTPFSFRDGNWMQQTNGYGTASVVDAALDAGVGYLLYASSAAIYGHGGPFREQDKIKPMAPYAASLARAEEEVQSGIQRGLRAGVIRLGTIFGHGPGMGFEDLVSRLTYLAGVRRSLVIHGNGDQVRPLIHLHDAARLFRICLDADLGEQPIVNGVAVNASVTDIVHQLQTLVPELGARYTDQDILNRISYSVDGSRAAELGFQPKFDLAAGLADVLSHWQHFQAYR